MYQVTDNYWTGKVELEEVCTPTLRPGGVLVRTAFSLISAGTERMKVQQAQMSLIGKARARPDQVTKLFEAVARDGVAAAFQKAMSRLQTPVPLGYSLAGIVVDIADDVNEFHPGDRVACAGSSANHAEFAVVPKNLCCRVPDDVPLDTAACATVGAIALQGVRQASPQLGDFVVVIGLGLLGQFCVQLLGASGCKILGVDPETRRLDMARSLGAHLVSPPESASVSRQIEAMSNRIGADVVIITASSSTADPISLAAEVARDRARIVDIGKTRLDLPWEKFYEKELELRMSRSYGPGRYDPTYEERGIDYPVGYVRWTERRNMELFLELLSQGKVRTEGIINQRFAIADAEMAYEKLIEDKSSLGILLEYPGEKAALTPRLNFPVSTRPQRDIVVGVIGAGHHCKSMLLPSFRRQSAVLMKGICAATGLSAGDTAKRFGFEYATTDPYQLLKDQEINTVIIATRHDLHAPLAAAALKAGKAVFLEKPLAIREQDVKELEELCHAGNAPLMVGYNRRFSPHAMRLADWMHAQPGPWIGTYRVNAGTLPSNHWFYDATQGGGRLLGEVCHFVDLFTYLFKSHPQTVHAVSTMISDTLRVAEENATYTLQFTCGSIANIIYSSQGDVAMPKERLELTGNGAIATLDNFRKLVIAQDGKKRRWSSMLPDKGHRACIKSFLNAVHSGSDMPIPIEDLFRVSHACFALSRTLQDRTATLAQ